MADDWYYDKTIKLMQKNGELVRGSWVEQQPTFIKDIPADVQPANREQIYKQYGYQIDCTKRAFCDITSGVDAGGLIEYRGQLYDIQKVIEWDDYLDVLMKEKS